MPATLAARVRVLGSGRSNKNDPNDAAVGRGRRVASARARRRSMSTDHASGVAAAGRSEQRPRPGPQPRPCAGCTRCWPSCRRAESPRKSGLASAQALLDSVVPADRGRASPSRPGGRAPRGPASPRRADRASPKKRIADAVTASGTTLTELFGVGPVVAAMVIGYTGDVGRFATADRFAAYNGTAPIEVVLRRPQRASPVAAREPPAQPRHAHRRDQPDPPAALRRPRLLRPQARRRQDQPKKRSARSSAASATPSTASFSPTPTKR